MKKRQLQMAIGVLVISAALCAAATFTWTGGSAGEWDDCGEWSGIGLGCACYPKCSTDDATVSTDADVDLNAASIDDLTLSGTITFDGEGSVSRWVQVNGTVSIAGGSVITLTSDATISDLSS